MTDDEVLVRISPRPGECQMRRYVCLITEALGLALFLFVCFVLTQADVFLNVRQIASRIVWLCGLVVERCQHQNPTLGKGRSLHRGLISLVINESD